MEYGYAMISCDNCIIYEGYLNRRKWKPFIRENRLPYFWVPKSSEADYKKMIVLKSDQIDRLEKAWKQGDYGRYEQLFFGNEGIPRIGADNAKEIYKDLHEYKNVMYGLLRLHEIDDEKRVQDFYQNCVKMIWISDSKIKLIDCSNYDYFNGYLKVGSYLQIRDWSKWNSFFNKEEAHFIKSVVDKLLSIQVKPENIGIITPYLAQKHLLLNEEKIDEEIQISSVDGFQ